MKFNERWILYMDTNNKISNSVYSKITHIKKHIVHEKYSFKLISDYKSNKQLHKSDNVIYNDISSITNNFISDNIIVKNNKVHMDLSSIVINNITDLIHFIDKYSKNHSIEFPISFSILSSIQPSLKKLNNFIGMNDIKSSILYQILYYIQQMNSKDDYMHMMLCGPPGTGKTEISQCIGDIFCKLGKIKKSNVKKVVRADLIAGYLGQTAIKTKEVFESALGGVLFIDEAYSLGNRTKDDSFAKECVDTLCELMSFHKDNIIVIIAGYEDEIRNTLFRINPGLESRFSWKYSIKKYTYQELSDIFMFKLDILDSWSHSIDKEMVNEQIKKIYKHLHYNGRDIEKLISSIKIIHSKRVFTLPQKDKKLITEKDLDDGIEYFLKHHKHIEEDTSHLSMYT